MFDTPDCSVRTVRLVTRSAANTADSDNCNRGRTSETNPRVRANKKIGVKLPHVRNDRKGGRCAYCVSIGTCPKPLTRGIITLT
jgi:hypothetical protein